MLDRGDNPRDLPDPRGMITARGDDQRAIGAERCADDRSIVCERMQHATAGPGIPDLCGGVVARSDHTRALAAERRTSYKLWMPESRGGSHTGGRAPDLCRI